MKAQLGHLHINVADASRGHYAVFFEDPDRLKLEIVHIPTAPPV